MLFLKIGLLAISAGGTTVAIAHWKDVHPAVRVLTIAVLALTLIILLPDAYSVMEHGFTLGQSWLQRSSWSTVSTVALSVCFGGALLCNEIKERLRIRGGEKWIVQCWLFLTGSCAAVAILSSFVASTWWLWLYRHQGYTPADVVKNYPMVIVLMWGFTFASLFAGIVEERKSGKTSTSTLTFRLLVVIFCLHATFYSAGYIMTHAPS